eukprot:GEMP01011002.1.p1 GENE.GEMP01011002.1~~GEMP01011002.1.p1  ORF type:complete len:562 (+),score=125.45 GEMP01011002.1:479-2164(+)
MQQSMSATNSRSRFFTNENDNTPIGSLFRPSTQTRTEKTMAAKSQNKSSLKTVTPRSFDDSAIPHKNPGTSPMIIFDRSDYTPKAAKSDSRRAIEKRLDKLEEENCSLRRQLEEICRKSESAPPQDSPRSPRTSAMRNIAFPMYTDRISHLAVNSLPQSPVSSIRQSRQNQHEVCFGTPRQFATTPIPSSMYSIHSSPNGAELHTPSMTTFHRRNSPFRPFVRRTLSPLPVRNNSPPSFGRQGGISWLSAPDVFTTPQQAQAQAHAQAQARAQALALAHAQAQAQVQAQTQAKMQAQMHAQMQAQMQAHAQAQAQAQAQAEAQTRAELHAQAQAQAQAEAQAQALTQMQAQIQAEAQQRANMKLEAQMRLDMEMEAEMEMRAAQQMYGGPDMQRYVLKDSRGQTPVIFPENVYPRTESDSMYLMRSVPGSAVGRSQSPRLLLGRLSAPPLHTLRPQKTVGQTQVPEVTIEQPGLSAKPITRGAQLTLRTSRLNEHPPVEGKNDIQPGSRVTVQGLKMHSELNGKLAEVINFDSVLDRWRIQLDEGDIVRISGKNIKLDDNN